MAAGIFKPDITRVPDLTYHPNDALAQLIVAAWTDSKFETELTARGGGPNVQALFAKAGLFFDNPVVITEDEYNKGYLMKAANEVVFVLPKRDKVDPGPRDAQVLLNTARTLMARTPCGI